MIHQAIFRITTDHAPIICQAISPECEDEYSERSYGGCRMCARNVLEVSLHATDLSSLRASMNSWLRLIQVASEMMAELKSE